MRQRKGPLFRKMEEQIVVLRHIAKYQQDDTITGNLTYCNQTFPRNQFEEIIGELDNIEAVVRRNRQSFDSDGIPISEFDYFCELKPPIDDFKQGDILIRIDKKCQDLSVETINEVLGVQVLQLSNRDKVGGLTD